MAKEIVRTRRQTTKPRAFSERVAEHVERRAQRSYEKHARMNEMAQKNPEAYERIQKHKESTRKMAISGASVIGTTLAATFPNAADALKKNPALAKTIQSLPADQQRLAMQALDQGGVTSQSATAGSSGLGGVFR